MEVIETTREVLLERVRGEVGLNEMWVQHLKEWIQLQPHLPKEFGMFLPQESSRSRVYKDSPGKTNSAPAS